MVFHTEFWGFESACSGCGCRSNTKC